MRRSVAGRAPRFRWALVGLLTVGCQVVGARDRDETADVPETAPAAVEVTTVFRGPIAARIRATSTIEAERQVTVHAEATGRLTRLDVDEGDRVELGRRVGKIEADLQAAGLERAQERLDKAGEDLSEIERLFGRGVAAKEELDNAKLAQRTAALDVRDRRRDVRNAHVEATLPGLVTSRLVTAGEFVAAGQPLFVVTDFDSLVARVYVPERDLDRVQLGQRAQVVGKAARGRVGEGEVVRIAPVVDPLSGTVKVTVALRRPEGSPTAGFLPGMHTEVVLTTDVRSDARLVPRPAVQREDGQSWVFLVHGDRVERRRVGLGLQDEVHCEIVEGLELGDEVVVSGAEGLRDGARVDRGP